MIPTGVRIFVCTEPVDMRYGFDRLAYTAKSRIGEDPQQRGALFVIANLGQEKRVRAKQRSNAQHRLLEADGTLQQARWQRAVREDPIADVGGAGLSPGL